MRNHRGLRTAVALWRDPAGVAVLEFAVLAPILVSLLLATVSFGFAFWTQTRVGNAARAGADYARLHVYDEAKIKAAANGATALGTVSPSVTQVSASCIASDGTITLAGAATTCPYTGAAPGTYVTVTTEKSYNFLLPWPGMTQKTLKGKTIARTQ